MYYIHGLWAVFSSIMIPRFGLPHTKNPSILDFLVWTDSSHNSILWAQNLKNARNLAEHASKLYSTETGFSFITNMIPGFYIGRSLDIMSEKNGRCQQLAAAPSSAAPVIVPIQY